MLKSKIVTICLLFFSTSVFAQDKFPVPAPVIVGAEKEVSRNEPVVLKVSVEKTKSLERTDYNWVIFTDDKVKEATYKSADGSTLIFGVGEAQKVRVVLVATNLYVVREKEDPKGQILEFDAKNSGPVFVEVKIKGQPLPPNPPVPPTPKPDVETKFGLTKLVFNVAQGVENRQVGANALAVAAEGIAASIRAGTVQKFEEGLTRYKEANRTALSVANIPRENWTKFGTEVQDRLYELYKAQKIVSLQDLAEAYTEIAAGLRLVK